MACRMRGRAVAGPYFHVVVSMRERNPLARGAIGPYALDRGRVIGASVIRPTRRWRTALRDCSYTLHPWPPQHGEICHESRLVIEASQIQNQTFVLNTADHRPRQAAQQCGQFRERAPGAASRG